MASISVSFRDISENLTNGRHRRDDQVARDLSGSLRHLRERFSHKLLYNTIALSVNFLGLRGVPIEGCGIIQCNAERRFFDFRADKRKDKVPCKRGLRAVP